MKYLKKEFKEFVESFKLKFNFLQIILFDLIFYASIMITAFATGKLLELTGAKLDTSLLTEEAITAASETQLMAFYSTLRSFVIVGFISVLTIVLVTLLIWSLTRGLIYTNLLKKKLTKEYYIRFVGLNTVLALLILIIMLTISMLLQLQVLWIIYFSALILGSIVYFTSLIYIKFTKSKKNLIFASIGNGLSFGAKKVHKLLITIVLIFIVGLILNYLISFLPQSIFLLMIFFIVYIAWARTYFVSTVERV